ncbi:MAG: D-alanyl-D-alanine endopeptidase [Spongiibacter sp.]|uniref:D-alanyl-D-alanine endopeptidase n=1 Tax=Spongiibacter thalassae TaxID=2721624 RepID=A0ABX1GAU6_9GAMM|nr:D-alanyl-D-alanine endopeptidase [Spongiibacter thalassae]MDX1504482.1 D-alanyl-D-alanine endopeptidase [Spongiibacter sp.]NKI16292.1 D-alanyl-D-alanine endopeptidase [Spongiibacter thalassae]
MRRLLSLVAVLCFSSLSVAAESNDNGPALKLASVSALAMDAESGEVLYQKHSNIRMPIASLTKVMTAMVVLDAKQSLREKIRFQERDRKSINHYFSRIRLGSEISRGEAMRLALMSSENLAAAALANNYPGGEEKFVEAMNSKAAALGMKNTRFVDSSGLSPRNVSTAADLSRMVAAAAKYPEIHEYSTTPLHTAHFSRPGYKLAYVNTNPLLRYERWQADVSKTGYLDLAGRCLIMQTEIDGRAVVLVMLDSYGKRSPIGDAGRIKRWIETGETGRVSAVASNYSRNKLMGYMAGNATAQLSVN